MFKDFLKRFLPPPTNTFNREIATLREHLSKQNGCIDELKTHADNAAHLLHEIRENTNILRSNLDSTELLLHGIDKKTDSLQNELKEQARLADEELISQLKNLQAEQTIIKGRFEAEFQALQNGRNEIQKQLQELAEAFAINDIVYVCDYEALFISENGFYEIREAPNFIDRYKALVRGLDEESIETVNQILNRHIVLKGHGTGDKIDLFTPKEKKTIQEQRTGFYSAMPMIRPDVYACGKYLLSTEHSGMGFIETTIFHDFAGFKKLCCPQKIRDKDILDIGAFIGDSTVTLAQFTDKNIYAFEPGYGNFKALKKTLEMNDCTNAIPVHAGIGAHSGVAKADTSLSMGVVLESLDKSTSPEEETKVISVDEFVMEHDLQIGLIKVDVEGYEREFLKGAEKTIKEQKPALLLSIYHTAEDFFGLKPLLESWNVGYTFQIHKEINEHIHFDTMLIAEVLD